MDTALSAMALRVSLLFICFYVQLAVGGSQFAVGGWWLAVRSWRFAVGGSQLAVRSWRLAVGGWRSLANGQHTHLLTAVCQLPSANYQLSTNITFLHFVHQVLARAHGQGENGPGDILIGL